MVDVDFTCRGGSQDTEHGGKPESDCCASQ